MRSYNIRLLCLFTAVLLLCLTFTGCDALDKARASQGYWREDRLLLNGQFYDAIPENPYLYPPIAFENAVQITEDDVPVLLSFLGDLYYISDDGLFLRNQETQALYCREDIYADITDKLTNGFIPTTYCYWSYGYEDEETVYTLTAEETSAISSVMASVEPTTMPAGISLDYTHWAEIYACTADHLWREYVYDVIEMDGAYYVTHFGETEVQLYQVPKEHANLFHHILESQRTADESWGQWDDEGWDYS